MIHRFYGMLRDGGMLCVVDLDAEDGTFHRAEKDFQGHNGFAHEEMAARFAKAGLEGVTETAPSFHIGDAFLNQSVMIEQKERRSMKNRLYALVISAMMLLVSFAPSSDAHTLSLSPLGGLGTTTSPPSGLPGDTIIPFPDANFEAAIREIIHKPKGDITVNDVEKITKLDVNWLGIADLSGIEYFTALELLDCGENLLTELDISQNTKLKTLACNMNYLTTLDVSHNPALERLICWENQLVVLDVSHNPALKYLTCDTNQLKALDVRHNPALEELRCEKNQLTTLDVSHNPALEWLSCEDNQLTTLDVSHNPALEWLSCGDNQLTILDVSHNPALEWLSCSHNRLTALDISNNTSLKHFYCNDNIFSDKSAIIGLDEDRLDHFVFN